MNTSEVLNRAADLIEERGWTQDGGGWTGTRLCLEGGILAALGWDEGDRYEMWKCPAYAAVADYVGREPGPESREVWLFNDAPGRTAAEVIEVLRAAAVIEASRERQSVVMTTREIHEPSPAVLDLIADQFDVGVTEHDGDLYVVLPKAGGDSVTFTTRVPEQRRGA